MIRTMLARFLPVLVVAAVVVAAVAAPASAQGARTSPNLLANPGMEEGGLFSPTGWDTTVAGVPTVLFYWDPDVKRSGTHSLSVVNAGDALPVWHNWNQMIPDARKYVGRDLEFSGWVKSQQMSGRGYVIVQCYRDTVLLYALAHGMSRDQARTTLGYKYADDPQLEMGWARRYFSADLDEWTEVKTRVYVPPTTNVIFVRAGIFGAGQVWFDDFTLTDVPAKATPLPLGKNLLANPGFERPFDDWEFSLPPTPQASIVPDSVVSHSGRFSARYASPNRAAFSTYMNSSQVFNARSLAGKRVRFSGWCKLQDMNLGSAYLNVYATGLYGVDGTLASESFSGTQDWKFYAVDYDVPKDTYTVWARAGVDALPGVTWWDDLKFEVLGDTPKTGPRMLGPSPIMKAQK
jgi:hypothetical protein